MKTQTHIQRLIEICSAALILMSCALIGTAQNNFPSSGNVTIGTTSAGQALSINGNIELQGSNGGTRWMVTDQSGAGTGRLVMQAGFGSAGAGGALNLYAHSHGTHPGDVVAGISSSSGGAFRVNSSALDGGTDWFYVGGTSGNVGIRTTSPGEMLSVNGGALGAYYYSSGYGIRGIFNHSGNSSGILSAGGLQIASQGTNNAANGSGDINFFVTGSNSTGAFSDGTYTQAVKIRYNGNVGIGTTSPGAKLDVNGSIYSSGQIRANALSLLMWGTDSGGTNRVLTGAPNIESQ
ncbi:MAG TPA: hypothetical protein VGC60_14435, partial [Pyrinomonadaceae bacterium]